jgi:hypothetical protein
MIASDTLPSITQEITRSEMKKMVHQTGMQYFIFVLPCTLLLPGMLRTGSVLTASLQL